MKVKRSCLQSVRPLPASCRNSRRIPLKGRLWIVEPGRLRVYDPHDEGS